MVVRDRSRVPPDVVRGLAVALTAMAALAAAFTPSSAQSLRCAPGNAGFTLPDGFCAVLVSDEVPRPRHLVVRDDGDVFVAAAGSGRGGEGGGLYALRDSDGDGRADVTRRVIDGRANGVLLDGETLYFAPNDRVLRYTLPPGSLEPAGDPEVIVSGLPSTGNHPTKSLALDADGMLYVRIGSSDNVCQPRGQSRTTDGVDPCPELATRAGVWRFDPSRSGQTQSDGVRFATGIRNAVALAYRPETGALYAAVHGRDALFQNFPELYTAEESAENPAEEFIRIDEGDDFGWPYCYYDSIERRKELGPEYGGDDARGGRCADAEDPLYGFPGHWAPNGLLFYTGTMFPARYRSGAFFAFHGSWNRAPEPQAGYNVTFLPMDGDRVTGRHEVFMDGFLGSGTGPRNAEKRPVGLAQGPDGSLYVTDDQGGTIWRIVYQGG